MKKSIITTVLFSLTFALFAQTSATFTQVLTPEETASLVIELDKPYTVKTTQEKNIKIETIVTLKNGGSETLQHLNRTGQYLLRLRKGEDHHKLTDNSRRKKAVINGVPIQEQISYVIYMPNY